MAERGVYLYAVAFDEPPPTLAHIRGVDGEPVYPVQQGDLVAQVSAVDLDEFSEEALERNLENIDWLARLARTHDRVVQLLGEEVTVAPARLATIFFSDEGVRRRLADDADALTAALRRVDGRREWSVKAYSPPVESEPDTADDSSTPGAEESGMAYLARRRRQRDRHEDRTRAAQAGAEQLHETIRSQTVDDRLLAPQDPRLSGHDGDMVLNGTYLVGGADGAAFSAMVRQVAADHSNLHVDVQGPWPPYSFATMGAQ